ncbi:low density lipoprotein receptor adapter protein 1-like [Rhopilema esculentum]|uniref:low density lipoprotein receptor adapter protein 1-like n=1 Tax=Rhopilema esculentum TaxID=499914 RepID=UPI0031D60149|eukprot:gene16663-8101_t
MDRLHSAFEGACRKLGLKRVYYKKREVCFKIKAMGLAGMPVDGVQASHAKAAVAELVRIWDKGDSLNVILTISASKGLRIKDKRGKELLCYKIYNIANCTVHKESPDVFLFMARQRDTEINCHAFYCSDEVQAEAICLCLSSAFHKAFEAWVRLNGIPPNPLDPNQKTEPQKEEPSSPKQTVDVDVKEQHSEKEEIFSFSSTSQPKRNFENGRRPSTLSEASAFSFNSQADEAFATLLAVEEGDETPQVPVIRTEYNWANFEEKQKVLSLLNGEDVEWEDDSQC